METTQVLLIVIVSVLAIILAAIGIQFFIILKDFSRSIKKVNKMLDDGNLVSNTVARSVIGISGVVSGVKAGLSVLNFFKKDGGEENEQEE